MAKRFIDPEIFDVPVTQWNRSNYLLLERNGFKCYYCGCDLTVSKMYREHFIPRYKNGTNSIKSGNIVPSCFSCNMKKGTKTIEEFRIKLFGKKNFQLFHFEKMKNNGKG